MSSRLNHCSRYTRAVLESCSWRGQQIRSSISDGCSPELDLGRQRHHGASSSSVGTATQALTVYSSSTMPLSHTHNHTLTHSLSPVLVFVMGSMELKTSRSLMLILWFSLYLSRPLHLSASLQLSLLVFAFTCMFCSICESHLYQTIHSSVSMRAFIYTCKREGHLTSINECTSHIHYTSHSVYRCTSHIHKYKWMH